MGDRQPARVADRLDLPRHARGGHGPGLVAPQHVHGLDEASRRVDLEVLALGERAFGAGMDEGVRRARRPVGLGAHAEVVLLPDRRVGDRLPQPFGRRADVDLEDFLHRVLQFISEADQAGRPRFGVLAHPSVVDEANRDRVEEVQLLAPTAPAHDQARFFQQAQVLRHRDPGHVVRGRERDQGLAVLREELVEQGSPGGVAECLERRVHGPIIGNLMVSCQGRVGGRAR